MATRYQRLATQEEGVPEEEHHEKLASTSDTTSTDMDMDDVRDADDVKTAEHQLLLPSDSQLHKSVAKRKAQLLKIVVAAIVCLLQMVAIPLFYGEVGNFWGEESRTLVMAAKYSLFGSFIVSCLMAPMLIAMFGIKVVMVTGCLSVCLFVSANFVPLQYSIVPAAVISGLTLGPFLTAQGVFVTNCAYRYCSTLTGCDQDAILNIANGLFYSIVLAAPLLSNAMSLLFLQPPHVPGDQLSRQNESRTCEPHSCPLYNGYKHELVIVPDQDNFEFSYHRIQALLGGHLAAALAGFVTCALVFNSNHPIITHLRGSKCTAPPEQYRRTSKTKAGTPQPCQVALMHHFRQSATKWNAAFLALQDYNLLFVLPLFLYLGMQQALIYNLFIKDVVGCRLDRQRVYLMRMLIASSSIVSSLPVAILARYLGRFRLALPTAVAQLSLVITMLLWRPGLDHWGALYVVGALWGCADAVWNTTTSALVGRIFWTNKDAAYSQLRLCQMTGILFIDLLRTFFCTSMVLYIFVAIFVLSFGSFVVFEIRIRLQLKNKMAADSPCDVTVDQGGATWVPGLGPHVPRQREALTGSSLPQRR